MHTHDIGYICMSGREIKMEIMAQDLDSWLSFSVSFFS